MRQYAMVFNISWLNWFYVDFQLSGTRGEDRVSKPTINSLTAKIYVMSIKWKN